MEKLDGKSKDIVKDNINKLKQLFPDVFTENGVDFDALKDTLGEYVDDKEERYQFTWHGKTKARRLAQTPSTGTLRPCKEESMNWDSTENLFIEGDNLEVLKLLQKSYHKKVKMIYIDPPYNTGNDFVYKDDFRDNIKNYLELTGQTDEEGKKLSANSETSGRYHTDWLNMMYPRLKLARNLLRDDGVIFISIDDNEISNLRKACDEIFGEENFMANFLWKKRTGSNDAQNNVTIDHDYVVVYSKSELIRLNGEKKDFENYKNIDDDPRGPWARDNLTCNKTASERPNLFYSITDPITGIEYRCNPNRVWAYEKKRMDIVISDGKVLFPKDGKGTPMYKRHLSEVRSDTKPFSSLIDTVINAVATKETRETLGGQYFDYPKSVNLLKQLVGQGAIPNDIILDFFSGSCTTANAVLELNKKDKGNRKFIMVQLPEPCDEKSEAFKAGYKTIADIGKERIRRVINKIETEQEEKNKKDEGDLFGHSGQSEEAYLDPSATPQDDKGDGGNGKVDGRNGKLDLGFKVFKLDSSNIKTWDVDFDMDKDDLLSAVDNVKTDRAEEDVLYEILLKYGLDLTLPIEELVFGRDSSATPQNDSVSGKKVFVVGLGALIVCLAKDVTIEVIEEIAKLKEKYKPELEMKVVFQDSSFKDDVVKTNAVQILKQHGIEDVKSI